MESLYEEFDQINFTRLTKLNRPIVVIPSYWSRSSLKKEDVIYDHPTNLLDPNETLSTTLKSLKKLRGEFDVLIIGAPTRSSIGKEMDDMIQTLIKDLKLPYKPHYFGQKEYTQFNTHLKSNPYYTKYSSLVSNAGYGNIRNLCLLIPHILGYSVAILIDDDEIILDPEFIIKATEFVGKELDGKILGLVLGFYQNEEGSFYLNESNTPWWELVWNKIHHMNKAFQIIEDSSQNSLVDSPFAFGGNMVIHKMCWLKVPFDPEIPRGEDMDYLRNVKHFGFNAKLDRRLSITHKPPKSQIPDIIKLQQDMIRFLYVKKKLKNLGINPSDYDPYPGYFLKETEGSVLLTELLYYIYHSQSDLVSAKTPQELFSRIETMNSVFESANAFAQSKSNSYIEFQRKWEEFMKTDFSDISFNITRKI